MYEEMTFENILSRCLARVPGGIDKREGSVIYDALAPAAAEIAQIYIELGTILDESFADTQTREFLIRRCAERGIIPKPATKAILEGRFNIDVPVGARFSLGALNYQAAERIALGVYRMECETAGDIGNHNLGTLIPIDHIDGLTSAELTAVLIPGENEEDTEALRRRYFDSLNPQAFGGNISDYKSKVNAINGVGGVKVYPVHAGGGTVRLVIINSNFGVPSAALLNDVQTAVDPIPNQGQGIGIAPIGHVVTVAGVSATTINISTVITYASGWDWAALEPHARAAIDTYLLELSKTWADTSNLIVRISQIETRILDLPGVIDITGTTINGSATNLMLDADSIPVRGALSG